MSDGTGDQIGPPLSVSVRAPASRLLAVERHAEGDVDGETGVVARVGRDGGDRADGHRWQDLDGLLGRGRRRLDVAGVVGRDAVEAVGVAGLAGERRRGIGGRDGGEEVNAPPSVDT